MSCFVTAAVVFVVTVLVVAMGHVNFSVVADVCLVVTAAVVIVVAMALLNFSVVGAIVETDVIFLLLFLLLLSLLLQWHLRSQELLLLL